MPPGRARVDQVRPPSEVTTATPAEAAVSSPTAMHDVADAHETPTSSWLADGRLPAVQLLPPLALTRTRPEVAPLAGLSPTATHWSWVGQETP